MSSHFQTRNRNPRYHFRRNGISRPVVILLILLIGGVAFGAFSLLAGGSSEPAFNPILAEVIQGEFVSKVLDQGEVESSENVELRCEVKARNGQTTVLKTTLEGSRVKEGDFLVQIDATSFEKELETQNVSVATAQTRLIQAETVLETAKATELEYIQGVFVEALQTIENEIYDAESQIVTAEQELEQSSAVYEHSEKLHSKGFITNRQLSADKFAVEKANIAIKKASNLLSLAKSKKRVLIEVTKKKELTQLKAGIRAAEVDLDSQQKSLAVEMKKIKEIQEMIDLCTIVVPKGVSGQVVFAKESSGRGNEWVLEEGATVRQNQVLIRLPDQNKMQVKALINEQNITQIERGMPATIQVDALDGTQLKGVVTKVNQYAESKGWFGSNVRKYAVFIRIVNPPETLKPGMNASVSIQSRFEEDVLQVPLQTVYSVQKKSFCLVKNGDQFETREIEIDGNNSKMVLVRSGLNKGDQLVMNPGLHKERMDLPEVQADPRIELSEGEMLASDDGKEAGGLTPVSGRSAAGAAEAGGRPSGGGGRSGGGGSSGMVTGIMSKYDTNKDDVIDATEMASLEERSKGFISRADADKDGQVTKAEMTKMASNMSSQWGGGGGGRPGGGGGGRSGGGGWGGAGGGGGRGAGGGRGRPNAAPATSDQNAGGTP